MCLRNKIIKIYCVINMITLVRTNGKQTLLSMCHIPEAFNIHCYCPNTLRARFMHQDNY